MREEYPHVIRVKHSNDFYKGNARAGFYQAGLSQTVHHWWNRSALEHNYINNQYQAATVPSRAFTL
jgi:hypothetical protein